MLWSSPCDGFSTKGLLMRVPAQVQWLSAADPRLERSGFSPAGQHAGTVSSWQSMTQLRRLLAVQAEPYQLHTRPCSPSSSM